ncbi:Ferretin [Oopsacas minuta]|uniref:Ferritin n=1 Tax=Oopsacas minuta TaxID=111878 RepID=A0AAV7JMP5_9METZ|nr:Ferretin [Oopsacas minuta]
MASSSDQYPVRQNYHPVSEGAINKQINMELHAFYTYLSMAYHFDRHDVGLQGFHEFFKKRSGEELEHAQKFMKYQNTRGGTIVIQDIKKPIKDSWGSCLEAMEGALNLERTVNDSLLKLHATASGNNDAHLCDFLESEYLDEQVEDIKKLGEHITNLKRVGTGLGEYMFDKETLKD